MRTIDTTIRDEKGRFIEGHFPLYFGKGKTISEETRKKISEAGKGRKHSINTRKKMSESHKGFKHNMYGKHHSKESKKRMSEAKKGCIPWIAGKKHTIETLKKMQHTLFRKGNIPWNKGLSKKTDERVANCATILSQIKYQGIKQQLKGRSPATWRRDAQEILKTSGVDFHGLVIHHVNGNITDNKLSNLKLMTRKEHTSLHHSGKFMMGGV